MSKKFIEVAQNKKTSEFKLYILDFISKFEDATVYKILINNIKSIKIINSYNNISAYIQKIPNGYIIVINEYFLKNFIENDEDLIFVLMHEFFHFIKGDFYKNTDKDSLIFANLISDLIINRELIKHFFKKSPNLIKKLYLDKSTEYISLLLVPPDLMPNNFNKIIKLFEDRILIFLNSPFNRDYRLIYNINKHQRRKLPELANRMTDLYYKAWFKDSSFAFLFENLMQIYKDFPEFPNQYAFSIIFIGLHKETPVKLKVEKSSEKSRLENLYPEISIVPSFDRKSGFLMGGGYKPVFFKNKLLREEISLFKVHLYIDVSISMWEYLPFFLNFIRYFKNLLGKQIYAFSNKVFPVSVKDIINGKFKTTFGTDFEELARHALKNKFKKIFIITDATGYPGKLWLKLKNKCKVFGIVTSYSVFNSLLWLPSELDKYYWILEEQKEKKYNFIYGKNSKRKISNPKNIIWRKRLLQNNSRTSGKFNYWNNK